MNKLSKKINTKTLRWLYSVPGKKKLYILILMVTQSFLGGSGVLYALLLREVVDSASVHDFAAFKYNVLLIILLVAVQLSVAAFIRWLNEYARSSIENQLKKRLCGNILRKDYSCVSALHSGEWLNRLTNDTVVVANGYISILPGLAGMVVKLVSALIMIVALERWFAYILVPGGIALILLTYAFRKILKNLHKRIQESDGKLRIFLQERIGSLIIIKSFAAEQQSLASLDTKLGDHKRARMKRNRFSNFCNAGFGAAMSGMYLLGVFYCGYGILKGTVTYGTLTAITQLIAQIQTPFANISGYLPMYYAMSASAERLIEAEEFEDDSNEDPIPLEAVKECYSDRLESFGLENACFTYYPAVEDLGALTKDNMPSVLNGISLTINKGDYAAFTGHSGCGKSTVMKLLMCIYDPDSGGRFIKEKGGKSGELTAKWRRLFAYVPQGNQLISGTIREIVSFSDSSGAQDNERIGSALRIACADEFVNELENGIDTLLGERGTGLSEGQMQRIAIARAIYSQSPVLLLDEATSALDEKTEKRLLKNLRSLTDKTVIIVTHRPAALSICTRIFSFSEDGITVCDNA